MLEINGGKSDLILFPRPNEKAEIRFFCFPFAGGSPYIFRNWLEFLPVWSEVGSIQLPGRGGRLFETPYRRIENLIEDLSEAMMPFIDKPFACFGHSMGALLIFELARFWRINSIKMPEIIFVSGCVAPQVYEKEKPIHKLPDNDLIGELNRLGGTPQELLENAELMQLVLPALRADFEMLHFYSHKPEPAFNFPIAAFGGDSDKDVDFARLQAWREQTTNDFSMEIFSGDHFFLLSQTLPLLEKINEKLKVRLGKAVSAQKV